MKTKNQKAKKSPQKLLEQLMVMDNLGYLNLPVYDGDWPPGITCKTLVGEAGKFRQLKSSHNRVCVDLCFDSNTNPVEVLQKVWTHCQILPNKWAAEEKLNRTGLRWKPVKARIAATLPPDCQAVVVDPDCFGVIPFRPNGSWGLFCNLDWIAIYKDLPNEWEADLELV